MLKEEIKLQNKERFALPQLTEEKVRAATDRAIKRLEKQAEKFSHNFIDTSKSRTNKYEVTDTLRWTVGMGTGTYWLAYELSGNKFFCDIAKIHGKSFIELADDETKLNDHDTGFKFLPSLVAQYKLTGDKAARKAALKAANILLDHFCPYNNFIIRVGKGGKDVDPREYRTLVDSMMNIPLFFWAATQTGNKKYFDAAVAHYRTTEKYLIREDGSSFHHYQFDPVTKKAMHGVTLQGYSDDSCWSRGHSWLVYGYPIAYSYSKNEDALKTGISVSNYFLNNLPDDLIPYWDFEFTTGSLEPRDSSAAAVAVCGLLELVNHLPDICEEKTVYKNAAYNMLNSLIDKCEITSDNYDGLLAHCTGSKPHGGRIDTVTTYGDYFYLEALMRVLNPEWKMYW